jgi:hypothetical protein
MTIVSNRLSGVMAAHGKADRKIFLESTGRAHR